MGLGAARPLVKGPKRPWLAFLLNLTPSLGVVLLILSRGEVSLPWSVLVAIEDVACFSCLIWGLGYAYLGRWLRFVGALLVAIVVFTAFFFVSLTNMDVFPKPPVYGFVVYATLLITIFGPLITAFDAWRLAKRHNAALLSQGPGGSGPPESTGS